MPGARLKPDELAKAQLLRSQGYGPSDIGKAIGRDWRTVKAALAGVRDDNGRSYNERSAGVEIPTVKSRAELSAEALRSLDEFGYFRARYFGRISSPWQEAAAHKVVELLASPDKEFVVVNAPPGSGKSTLFAHDIPAWLTARDRSLRGLIGSRTYRQAEGYTARLRRTLERKTPMQAKDDERQRGLALDAVATLAMDFGRFRPECGEVWQRGMYIVEQLGETPVDEKEATWTAFGMDSGSLGWRVNFIDWDDLVDKTVLRTIEAMENQQVWWDDEAETRLEPAGLALLQGQRMSSTDLYRYNLNKVTAEFDLEEDEESPLGDKKYIHIVYKAHYEDQCQGEHKPSIARPWPDGCLLDPVRLPWRELRSIKANRAGKFEVLYQQEDVDPSAVLVPKLWVDGGRGADGVDYPGCWDRDRGLAEIPVGLAGRKLSVVSCDPSPTKYWAIEWWLHVADSEFRYLLDLIRQAMDAPDFLDWSYHGQCYTGVLEEWWQRSKDLGHPFTHLIVEANAAQRFMLQYEHFRRWASSRGVLVVPHQTHRNKTDPEFGVQMIAPHWEHGRIRLPGRPGDLGRIAALKLVDEVTRYPEGQTDDCVMAEWFFEHNLPKFTVQGMSDVRLWRPSFMRSRKPTPAA